MKKLFLGLAISALISLPVLAALKVGDKAPDFSARASLAGKEFNFSLESALKKGPVVVYFYPSAYTKDATSKRTHLRRRRTNSMPLVPPSLVYRPTASRDSISSPQTRSIAPESSQ